MLLLPKASEQHARGQSAAGLLGKSLLSVSLLSGGATIVFFLFPSLIVSTFFGEQYLANASLLGLYGLAMMSYSLVNVWLFYYLATREQRYSYIILAGAIVQVSLFMILPLTLKAMIGVMIGIGVCLSLVGILGVKFEKGDGS